MIRESLLLAQLYWKQENPTENIVTYLVLGGLLVILLVYGLAKNGIVGLSGSSQGFSRGAFRRAARAAGLAEEDADRKAEAAIDNLAEQVDTLRAERDSARQVLADMLRNAGIV